MLLCACIRDRSLSVRSSLTRQLMSGHHLSPLQFAISTAHQAGRMIMKDFHKPVKSDFKGYKDVVTKFDRASEAFIKKQIAKTFPDHNVLGEETGTTCGKAHGASGKTSRSTPHSAQPHHESRYTWIIDPIDGTKNFSRRFHLFSISIALYKDFNTPKEKPVLGVVYAPYLKETFWAEKGKGAYRQAGPQAPKSLQKPHKIKVSKTSDLAIGSFVTGFHPDNIDLNMPIFRHITHKSYGARRLGSAALDLCFVAAGQIDGSWEFGLKIWDIAAGRIILEEAGGCVTNIDGTAFNHKKRSILATNKLLHKKMVKEIRFAGRA